MVFGTAINVVWSCGRLFPEWPQPQPKPLPSSVRFYGLQKKGIRYASTVIANEQQLLQYIDFRGTYDAIICSDLELTPTTLGSSNHMGLSPQQLACDQGTRSVVRADNIGEGPGRGLRTSLWWRACNHLRRCGPSVSAWTKVCIAKCLYNLAEVNHRFWVAMRRFVSRSSDRLWW